MFFKVLTHAIIFQFTDLFFVTILLILEATQMQHPMKYHPVQFFLISGQEFLSILLYPVHANIYLTCQLCFFLTQLKCNDIRKIIMLQEFLVYFEQVIITAKNKIQLYLL